MHRYPQLLRPSARALISELSTLSVTDAAARASVEHRASVYSPLGNPRVPADSLGSFRQRMLTAARTHGYPDRHPKRSSVRDVDGALLAVTATSLAMSAHESTHPGVWEFLSCVLLPDIVIWRFGGESGGVSLDRFMAGRRNAIERLWRRQQFLGSRIGDSNDYSLIQVLSEDELVQIMERPRLVGHRELLRAVVSATVDSQARDRFGRDLLRDVQKRVLRATSIVCVEALSAQGVSDLASNLVRSSISALEKLNAAKT